MSRTIVYLSGPLSTNAPTLHDRLANVGGFIDAHRALMERGGYSVIDPGLTFYVDPNEGYSHESWIAADLPLVELAHVVVRLPGASRGADEECQHAMDCGIPVVTLAELLE